MVISGKFKNIFIVLEGFIILNAFHALGGYYFAPMLAKYFSGFPLVTISMLSSSAISPVIAIIYVAVRANFLPKFTLKRETLMYILSGGILAWLVSLIDLLISGKEIPLAQEILKTPSPYYYLNFYLLILWGPILEEILNRGYFFEILRHDWGIIKSLLLSSLLFVIPHGIWGSFDFGLIFIFMNSVIFTLMYIQGGLIASISVHAFVNFYFLYLNMG